MALQFNPPDWLIQEYMQRKSEPQQALETLVGAATTYGQFKQTQDQNKIANEFKAADSKRQDETLNIARQKDARESAAIGYDPTNPTEYLDMVREKMRSENKLKQAQAGEADAKADYYRNRPAPAAGGAGGLSKPPSGFRWTETGDLEAIPGGPQATKIPPREQKELAQAGVSRKLQEIGSLYKELRSAGGIVDEDQPGLANVGRRISASAAGQMVGGALGTKEQSLRQKISSIRPLLMNDIRQASQMGARGLDSEKELEFFLKAATDPTMTFQANMNAIKVLNQAYGLGYEVDGQADPAASGVATGGLDPAKQSRLAELRAKREAGTLR